ncbi:hypothetical protein ACFO6Q_03955 [Dokdonella ginsengisoli]|uniref:Uncharacterized protein n=2 Tax=Dokdonella ginsengisoli TaxID=363846 RepID=A0ABV9QQR4_9GAMM
MNQADDTAGYQKTQQHQDTRCRIHRVPVRAAGAVATVPRERLVLRLMAVIGND